MFGKRELEGSADRVETLLGRSTEFRGALISSGHVRIDGKLEGEISHAGELIIGESASVTANIKTKSLTVAGHVKGNIDCEGRLELVNTARIFGDIKVGQLVIADGAVFQGVSSMRSAEPAAPRPNPKPA